MSPTNADRLEAARQNATQGESFFAEVLLSNGETRKSPFFVLGVDEDPQDVIVCKCTKSPARSEFDIEVKLKLPTFVRANKIYTVSRSQLQLVIPQKATPDEFAAIVAAVKKALNV